MIDRDKSDKRDRLKRTLRENLKRRKAQARGRASLSRAEPRNDQGSDGTRDASAKRDPGQQPPDA